MWERKVLHSEQSYQRMREVCVL